MEKLSTDQTHVNFSCLEKLKKHFFNEHKFFCLSYFLKNYLNAKCAIKNVCVGLIC